MGQSLLAQENLAGASGKDGQGKRCDQAADGQSGSSGKVPMIPVVFRWKSDLQREFTIAGSP
ncbi:hypothetical protein [Bradyrhizobium sp. dw_78]|uniref:hypothetical protein n=1 Tax=Bradyrhizobium sp. dw_78 TaxID=2719793 RepID=UPI001BD4E9EA|nr:hypothetical protein [Bradyrhizobium sp. dw_78]